MLKGVIAENRIQVNLYKANVQPGIGAVTFTSIGALEEEMDRHNLPDGTSRSGGRSKPIEFEVKVPTHHDLEIAAMDLWWREGQHPQSPTYLKVFSLTDFDTMGLPRRSITLLNTWISKRGEPERTLGDEEGTMSEITYTLVSDENL